MTKKAKMASRIRKLLALAESANENEAATAAAMAQKLMREHAINMSTLSEQAMLEEDPVEVRAIEIGKQTWAVSLAWSLGSHCNLSVLRSVRRGTIVNPYAKEKVIGDFKRRTFALAYGHRSDLEVWEYLYSVAKREIQRLTKIERQRIKKRDGWVTRTEGTSYREGCVAGLGQKLREMKHQAERQEQSTETALALQSRADRARDYMRKANPTTGAYRGGVGASSAGYRDGQNIDINAGLKAGSGSKRLGGA